MRLRTIVEDANRLYYVPMPYADDQIDAMPDCADGVRCWADDPASIEAMSGWLNGLTTFGKLIEQGSWSLYQFIGPKPVQLPFCYSLNYVDMEKADKLTRQDLADYTKWLYKTDPNSELIINSAYEGTSDNESFGHWTKGRTTHAELVKVLSDIVKTLGPLVWSPQDSNPNMRYQVIATVPFKMIKINHGSVADNSQMPKIPDGWERIDGYDDDDDFGYDL